MPAKKSETHKEGAKPKSIRYFIVANPTKEPDIIEKLSSVSPMSKYVKELIRRDIGTNTGEVTDVLEVLSTGDGKTDRRVFQENFCQLMKEAKISNRTLAECLSTYSSTVNLWRTGKVYPMVEQRMKICKFFGISHSELHEEGFLQRRLNEDLLEAFNELSFEGKCQLIKQAKKLKDVYGEGV